MTIRTTARVAGPFAAGAQSLPFAFKVFAASDICVVRRAADGTTTHLFIGLDYGVTLHANQETTPGGTVSLTVATPPGFTTLVSTSMPELQLLALTNQGGFQPEVINDALDKQTIMIQQLRARIGAGCGPGGGTGGGGGGTGGPIYLSSIEQSGAATGQIPRWNGTEWVASNETAGGGGTTPVGRYAKRIVCVGDSETSQQVLWGEAWPAALERSLRSSGADCEVINLGIGSHTYFKANTVPRYGALTVRQKLIALQPDIVLVALGAADAVMLADGRTVAQMKQDATDFYSAVRTALPNCTVVYMSQTPYDVDHATPATLKNKHVLPYQFSRRGSGLLTNCFSSEILDDDLAPATRSVFDFWKQLDDHIKALPSVSGSAPMNLWRAARIGLLGFDQLHVSAAGSMFLAGYARKAFATVPALSAAIGAPLMDYAAPASQDPDRLFTGMVQNTGTEWATKSPDGEILQTLGVFGDYKAADAVAWFMPSKSSVSISNTTYLVGSPFVWTVNGSYPITQVQTSLNGAAWINSHFTTDAQGDFLDAGTLPVTAGTYTLRYKIGDEVHGPMTITAVGSGGGTSADKLRIVVVGDSESAHQALLARPWPALLAEHLSASRPDIEVVNLGLNGHTFHRANTVATYGGKTMRQRAIDSAPAILLVALGFNDTVTGVDARTVAQAQADASAFFSAVKAALPSCKVVYLSEVPYDTTHGTPSTLTNQQVLPVHMALRISGILAGCYCSEVLADAASSATRTAYGNWKALDDTIKGLGTIDGNAPLNLWRAARLGLTGYDGLHMTAAGHYMLAGYARKAFTTVTALASAVGTLPDQAFPLFNDPDTLFTGLVQSASSVWQAQAPTAELSHVLQQHGVYKAANAVAWYLPSKSAMSMSNRTYTLGSPFVWTVNGSYPITQVQTSLNGAAWINSHFTTDAQGDFLDAGTLPVTAGTYTMRYKIGNEVHGPETITVVGSGGGGSGSAAFGSITDLTGTAVVSTDGAPVQVPLNTAAAVTANGMTASGGYLRVPRAGRYRITFGVMATTNASGACSFVARCSAGSRDYNGSTSYTATYGYAQQSTGSVTVELTAGQDVTLWAYKYGVAVTVQDAGGVIVANWLTVEEVV